MDLLLDTNIVIYLAAQEARYLDFVAGLGARRLGISVVSYMELLVGVRSAREGRGIEELLSQFEIVPLHEEIAMRSAVALRKTARRSLRNPRLADTIIAQTALAEGVPLVTNNPRDFARFAGLKLITP
jgi:tRNA(fMet)-specific endonuclease VapC